MARTHVHQPGSGSQPAHAGIIPFFAFSPEIRRVIYTTNAIESLNRIIQTAIRTRGVFPSEDAAEKRIHLALRGHEKTAQTVRGWLTAVNQFAFIFEDRFKPIQAENDPSETGPATPIHRRPDTSAIGRAYRCLRRQPKASSMSIDIPGSCPVTPRSRLKRRHDRATIYPVLDAGLLAHVAYVIDGQPFCTPTIH